jgi:hypothetical protein
MEGITRLVSESLARHGFDRPLDYRRLHWSSWFRCESPHSLLFVPSKPGVFALAEEIMVGAAARSAVSGLPVEPERTVEERPFRAALSEQKDRALAAEARRMLAVTQFFEDDDMAFVLDRMMARQNPMRDRLASGRYFVRFVVIQDDEQRRSICSALNQWIANSSEKVSGIGAHFASSLELASVTGRAEEISAESNQARNLQSAATATASQASVDTALPNPALPNAAPAGINPNLDSGARANVHCPSPFPSGF